MPHPHQVSSERVYAGRVFSVDRDTVRFPDGSSGVLDIIRHPGAAAVVPVLSAASSADPQILLIRQFRYAAEGPIWEVPAGTLGPGETPEACARRELEEEAGVTAGRLEQLTTIFTTPGFTDEQIHLYAAHDLKSGTERREADEFIEAKPFLLSQALEMIRDGDMVDAKSTVAILYWAGFRVGL